MKNTATTFEINPVVFTADYIVTHLLPVIQKPTDDDTLVKESFLDLELIFKVVLEDSETGLTTYRLTKELADSLFMDTEYLKKCAWGCVFEDVTCQSMGEIFGFPGEMDMYVFSNTSRNLGAGSAFICTLKLKELAKKLHANELIIIPSSIHELIVINREIEEAEFLNQVIRDVNSEMVPEKEQISDHYYIYHADTDSFTW